MNTNDYWQLFWETGAPEMYLLYSHHMKLEDQHVRECSGRCPQNNRLQ